MRKNMTIKSHVCFTVLSGSRGNNGAFSFCLSTRMMMHTQSWKPRDDKFERVGPR